MSSETAFVWHYKERTTEVSGGVIHASGGFEHFYFSEESRVTQAVHAMASVRLAPGTPYAIVRQNAGDFGRSLTLAWSTYRGLDRAALIHRLSLQGRVYAVVGGTVAIIEEEESAPDGRT